MKEAELKSAVEDYLEYGMNQGKWYYDRLNSGSIVALYGESERRIRLCREGTADYFVLKQETYLAEDSLIKESYLRIICRVIFLELKGDKGKQRPEQGAFQKMIEEQGASYFIIRSIEELQRIL